MAKILFRLLIFLILLLAGIVVFAWLFINYYPGIGKLPDEKRKAEYEENSKNFRDGQFQNINEYTLMTGEQSKGSEDTRPQSEIKGVNAGGFERRKPGELHFRWYGHSSLLIQLGKINVLVDPMFSKRSSPVGFAGPKRFSDPGIRAEDIENIDVVFISHDHYDHLDYKTIKKIDSKVGRYIVPLGIDSILEGWGVDPEKISALDWWNSTTISGAEFTLVPAQHFSNRNPLKSGSTLWGGIYMEDSHHSAYFTGDSGYLETFSEVGKRFGGPDIMFADSGQYNNAWKMTHMTPEQAVQAAVDAKTTWYIPVHWGAFVLSNHSWKDPVERALVEAGKKNLNIATPKIGEDVNYSEINRHLGRWWEDIK